MAVCHVCVGVLDVVVTEWRRGELPGDEGAVCVACGAPAEFWVSPTQPPPDAVIAVDLTGNVLRIEVSGSLGAEDGAILACELVAVSERGEPVVVDLRGVTAVDEAAGTALEAAVRDVLAAGVHLGIVTSVRPRWTRKLTRRSVGRSLVIGDDVEAVLAQVTHPSHS